MHYLNTIILLFCSPSLTIHLPLPPWEKIWVYSTISTNFTIVKKIPLCSIQYKCEVQ